MSPLLVSLLRRLLRSSSNERGSILLIAIVSVAVVSLLGLAVYDLALIESNFSAASVIDYRAYEIAQAGIERGTRELRNLYLSHPPGQETFVAGSTTCAPTPCDTTQFHPASLTNATVGAQTIAAGPFAGAVDPGGTYTLEVKYLTIAEANNPIDAVGLTYPTGLQCFPDTVHPTWCANLAFLRSTGTATDGGGHTRTRTIQTLVRASSTSPWAGGIIAGSGAPAVSGEVLIGGSVHILGVPLANPALDIRGGSNAGMVNNWYPLSSTSGYSQSEAANDTLSRLTPKQRICPPSTSCAGGANLVESLGAELKIFGNAVSQMVNVGGGTSLGQSGSTALYGSPARIGKGPLDGVYIAGGCALPCTGGAPQPFNGGASVFVDRGNLTKPYPNNPPLGPLVNRAGSWYMAASFNDDATISDNVAGTDYPAGYFNNWFLPRAAVIANGTLLNPANCVTPINCGQNSGGTVTLSSLIGTANKLTDSTPPFRHQVTFKDRVTGFVRTAEICWRRDLIFSTFGAGDGGVAGSQPQPFTLEFGIDDPVSGKKGCENPNAPSNPLLALIQFGWGIDSPSASTYNYRGAALVVTSPGGVQIDAGLQSHCAAGPPCTGEKFPENHLLAIMALQSNIDLATIRAGVPRIMGYFFVSGANITVKQDVVIAGMLRADNICFRNSGGCGGVGGGGKIPGFFQASFFDQRKIPNELPAPFEVPGQLSGGRWQVTPVPPFWIECRRGPSDTLPPTPSGICGYQ